ncbi:hypothetical protein [Occallatibacter savannae]|uniref:hypothetical protein n=1 Tax=Occallatibacter savannae TaxID=1002691 RepID=UPI000D696066|nr:hypothetical protein [Occallatibacter savannae]
MSLESGVQLKTVEYFDALEFTVLRETGGVQDFIGPAISLILICWFWYRGNLGICILIAIVTIWTMVGAFADRVHGRETRLRVTIEGVIAHGNLGHVFSTHEQVGIADLAAIRYHPGDGEGEAAGLYAHLDLGSRMLLPSISGDQANEIIEAIRKKFPGLPAEPYAAFRMSDMLIFDRGDTITLGLSKPERDQQGLSRNSPDANSRIRS